MRQASEVASVALASHLCLGHEVAGHEPQGVLRLGCVFIRYRPSIVAGDQDFRAAVGLGVAQDDVPTVETQLKGALLQRRGNSRRMGELEGRLRSPARRSW